MTLKSTGIISLSEVQTEFGGANPISMSEYYRGGAYVPNNYVNTTIPTSGAINYSTFYSSSSSALGINWTLLPTGLASNYSLVQIASNNTNLVVAVYQSGDIIYSDDYGATWAVVSTSSTANLWGCTYAAGYFYIVDDSGNRVQRSTDGVTWTTVLNVSSRDNHNINYNNGYFVLGSGASGGSGFIYSSTNGTTWVQSTNLGANSVFCGIYISAIGRTFAAGSQYGYYVGTPNSTSSWSAATGLAGSIRGVAWSPTAARACVVSTNGRIYYSTNLATWNEAINTGVALYNIQWCDNQFVAVGDSGKLLTSTDGITWVTRTTGTTLSLRGVASISTSSTAGAALFVTAVTDFLRS